MTAERGESARGALAVDAGEHLPAHAFEVGEGRGLFAKEVVPGQPEENDIERRPLQRHADADFPVAGTDQVLRLRALGLPPARDHRRDVPVRPRRDFGDDARFVTRLLRPARILPRGGAFHVAPRSDLAGAFLRDRGERRGEPERRDARCLANRVDPLDELAPRVFERVIRRGEREGEGQRKKKPAHRGPASDRREGLGEVGDQVFDVLDADRDADEPRRDAEAIALRLGDRGVGHGRGMRDQRLDAAEALAERAEPHGAEEASRGLVGPEIEGDHRAESPHLLFGEGVLRMVGQAGVVDLFDLRLGREEPRDLAAVCLVALHAHGEGLDAPQDEPGIERREDRPRAVLDEAQPLIESEWPFKNFVVEWTTRSAPRSRGFCR